MKITIAAALSRKVRIACMIGCMSAPARTLAKEKRLQLNVEWTA
jgi:hypothetical protein